jgi:hypothetical protein
MSCVQSRLHLTSLLHIDIDICYVFPIGAGAPKSRESSFVPQVKFSRSSRSTVLALKFVYCLDGRKAALISSCRTMIAHRATRALGVIITISLVRVHISISITYGIGTQKW